jgi:hypothetical protein
MAGFAAPARSLVAIIEVLAGGYMAVDSTGAVG